MEDQAQFYSKYWRDMHEKTDLETVRSKIVSASGVGKDVGLAYLKELEEKQDDEKHEDAIATDMDTNKILAQANKISSRAVRISLFGAAISMMAAGVSLWVAFFKDQ